MSLLTLCQDAANICGVSAPSSVIGATGGDAIWAPLAKQSLQFLADSYDWEQLRVPDGSVTLATGTQAYSLPTDFLRFVPDTMWDRSNFVQQDFPIDSAEWAEYKGSGLLSTIYRRARVFADKIQFADTITSSDNGKQIFFEYISNNKALNGSTPVADLTVDTYTSRLPEILVTLGVVWRYKQQKGLEWQADRDLFERELQRYISSSNSSKPLNMASQSEREFGITIRDRGYG